MEIDAPEGRQLDGIWVFSGIGARLPAGVFSDVNKAERWIAEHGLSGILTFYPLNEGAYDWALRNDLFKPTKGHHRKPEFIQRFSGGQQHHHYESGRREC